MRTLRTLSAGGSGRKFGTFGGVFTPNVLTILGVIMFLRLGWVVGNAGFLGAVAIILLAKTVTVCTGLSMSSITTNTRIGAGGAFSIISRSLGLEAGGSVGIPLYIAQTLSVALYIVGFTEGWLRIFPTQHPLVVSTFSWFGLLVISYVSAKFAIRVQYIILLIIGFSLVSFFLTPAQPVEHFVFVGDFQEADFWMVFAIFFPAVTGIMAGANLSGDLEDPRRSIPVGTMTAILVTLIIYIGLAYVLARTGTQEELRANQMFLADRAIWGPAVIAGILGATFSSALGSMLGAPRILQALAEQKTIPFFQIFSKKTPKNEPRNAIIFTGILVEFALLTGNLDSLAAMITMFFLITYATLNMVIFIQQEMKIISFRPTFKIPKFVPLLGSVGCVFIMFLINPVFSVLAIVTIIFLYIWLARTGLQSEWGDIRGGLYLVMAERASRLAARFPRHQITWKPDLLVPVDNPDVWAGSLLFIRNIVSPAGSIYAFTVKEYETEKTENALRKLLYPLSREGILIHSAVIEDHEFLHGAKLVIQTLRGGAFRPNILFLTIGEDSRNDDTILQLIQQAKKGELGIIILKQHPRKAFGMQKDINIWLRDQSPNWHLALLVTLQLQLNWGGKINLVTVASKEGDEKRLNTFLERLSDHARLPWQTEFHVLTGGFKDSFRVAPRADINVFGLGDESIPFDLIRELPALTASSCLFVKDSGQESALV